MSSIEERIQKLEKKQANAERHAVKHGNLCTFWNQRHETLTEQINKLKAKQEKKVD